jgi:putative spermidine/putrescine transport system permease protein
VAAAELPVVPARLRSRALAVVDRQGLLIVPGLVFLAVFFAFPLVEMAVRSVTEPSAANYTSIAESTVYMRALRTTFLTALIVTVSCLALGYPYAYLMSQSGPRLTALLMALVLLPFWSSILVRTYAWQFWLEDTGVINTLLQKAGIIDEPLGLIRNTFGVVVAMTQVLLPFMVLPLYVAMRRIDPALPRAAGSLGASPFVGFRRVFLPLSLPGVATGSLLVFILALGFYFAPALLGGPRSTMISQLIVDEVQTQGAFGLGAAMGIVLLVATLLVLAVGARLTRIGDLVGWGDR